MIKRFFALLATAALLLSFACSAQAHETVYDGKRVTLIIGTSSSNDDAVRIAEAMKLYFGRALHLADVKIEAVNIDTALQTMRTARPDGLTILAFHDAVYLKPLMGGYGEEFSLDHYEICGRYAQNPGCGFLARGDAPFNDMKELAEQLAADPKAVIRVALETGGVSHAAFSVYYAWVKENYGDQVARQFRVVENGSISAARQMLWAGEIDLLFADYSSQNQYTKSNTRPEQKMKFVGMLNDVPGVSGLPTLYGIGVTLGGEPFRFSEDFLLYLPQGTPIEYRETLDDAIAELEATPGYLDAMERMFYEPNTLLSYQAEREIRAKAKRMSEIAQAMPPLSELAE